MRRAVSRTMQRVFASACVIALAACAKGETKPGEALLEDLKKRYEGRILAFDHATMSVAPWLKQRGVSFVGSDVAQDVVPSLVEGINLPFHTAILAGLGVDILDNQDLEAVAETAAKLNRWEFLMTVAPVPVTGGTGFPANALAIF